MKFVICGNYGVGNLGDEAIAQGLKFLLLQQYPEATTAVMGKGNLLPIGVRSFVKSLFNWDLWRRPLKMIREADVFVLGGGALFTQEESFFVPFFWALHGAAALFLGRKLWIIAVSIEKLGVFSRFFVKYSMKRAEKISVRDEFSSKLLSRLRIKHILGPDLAFFLHIKNDDHHETKKYVVLCPRTFKNNDAFTHTFFAQLCDMLFKDFGLNIVLLSLKVGDKKERHLLNKILDQSKHKESIKIIYSLTSINEAIEVIKNAEFVVTMRLHGGIFSLITQTPFYALNYMDKVQHFWDGLQVAGGDFSQKNIVASFNRRNELKVQLNKVEVVFLQRKYQLTTYVST